MKQQLAVEDIICLSGRQKESLRRLWAPKKYDLAVASVCKNAATNEFENIEFIVGKINIDGDNRGCSVTLESLNMPEIVEIQTTPDSCEPDEDGDSSNFFSMALDNLMEPLEDDTELEEEELDETCLEDNYFTPDRFFIDDCLPLLNIGQMIEILLKNSYGCDSFYLTISKELSGLGRNIADWNSYGSDFENTELCDALWEGVKGIL